MSASYFAGRVHSVVYENSGNAFYILKMVLDVDPEATNPVQGLVSVKGNIPGIRVAVGSWFGFEAKWVHDETYGKQLAITRAPVLKGGWDADTAIKMLSANGVGSQVMQAIRGHFDDDDLVAALEDAIRLEEVPGFTKFTAMHVASRWTSMKAHFKGLEFLSNLGLPAGLVRGIWTHFGDDAEMVLTQNPWALVEVEGITFAHAEEVARRFELNNPVAQVRGAVLYTCKANRSFGHLFLRTGHILQTVQGYLGEVSQDQVLEALASLHKDNLLVIDRKTRPGVVAVYEPWSYETERRSTELLLQRDVQARFLPRDIRTETYLKALGSVGPGTQAAGAQGDPASRLDRVVRAAIDEWGQQAHLTLSEPQKEGIFHALSAPVSVLSGLPGTGKCVVPSTLVSGPWGMAPIGVVVPVGVPEGEFRPFNRELDTSEGVRLGTAVFNGGIVETIRVTTQDGYSLEGTPEHPIQVVKAGAHQWRTLGSLQIGDVPVIFRGGLSFGLDQGMPSPSKIGSGGTEHQFPEEMTPDVARILGYLISEGSVVSESGWAIASHDSRIQDYLIGAFERSFGYTPSRHYDKRVGSVVGIRFGARQIIRWFRALGVEPVGALDKKMPARILTASKASVRCFLQALFEGDGGFCQRDVSVEYGTSSAALARQLQVVLLGFGIVSTRHPRKTPKVLGYRVTIRGQNYVLFREVVGFHFTELPLHRGQHNTNRDLVYGAEDLVQSSMASVKPTKGAEYNKFYRCSISGKHSRKPPRERALWLSQQAPGHPATVSLRQLCQREYYYSPIALVTRGLSQVLDFSVPDGHQFLSDGFISHNTTSLRAAVRILQDAGVPFLLVAPTGIAAKNLASRTGASASTIHRAFAAKGKSEEKREATYAGVMGDSNVKVPGHGDGGWGYGPENPYPADVVILDEASMLDQHLLFRLLNCTRPEARLVFVGDHAQLPSVGPGNVLRDLISSGVFPTVKLTQIFRQEDTSGIIYAAHSIHAGDVPDLNKDFKLLSLRSEDDVLDAVLKIGVRFFEARKNFQILSPKHNGTVGVTNLNSRLRELLNPASPGLAETRLGDDTIREGDRIMVIQNDYKLGVYNGDVGKVAKVDRSKKEVEIKIYGDVPLYVRFEFKEVPRLIRLAYACTVHKCVAEGTLIATRKGLVPIEKLIPHGSNGRRVHPVVHEVAGTEGWACTDQVFDGGLEPTVQVRTRLGFSLEGSRRHPVLTMASDGTPQWKILPDVVVGDVLVLRKGTAAPESTLFSTEAFKPDWGRGRHGVLPGVVSSDLAWLLGVLVGDGNQTDQVDGRMEVTQRDESFCIEVARLWGSLFGLPATKHRCGVYVHSRMVREFLNWCGLGYHKAPEKRVPWVVLESPPEVQGAFIRGLFDTDGGVSRLIHLTTTSDRLAREVQQILLHLGIVSGKVLLRDSVPEKGWAAVYRVQVTGSLDSALFEQRVGFSVVAKAEALQRRVLGCSRSKSNVGEIPCSALWADELRMALRQRGGRNYPEAPAVGRMLSAAIRGMTPLRISHLPWLHEKVADLNDMHPNLFKMLKCGWFFDPVEDVSTSEARVLDLHVPDGHAFVGGGFVNHNSQGLEYDSVVLPLVMGFMHQLQRNLLYTAITRARKQVVLVGHHEALAKAVNNAREDERATLFLDRLIQGSVMTPSE